MRWRSIQTRYVCIFLLLRAIRNWQPKYAFRQRDSHSYYKKDPLLDVDSYLDVIVTQ